MIFNNEVKLLRKENDNLSRWLNEDDEDILDNIMGSIGVFRVNSFDTEVIRRDLIGMAEEARLRDSNMKEAIGDDIKLTTYEIIKNSRGSSKLEIVLLYLKYLSGIVFVMLGFSGIIANSNLIWDVSLIGLLLLVARITYFFLIAN